MGEVSDIIPIEALANHLAFLGKTGSGKSNAAKVVVEGLLDRGERVCIVDPTGAWYGLRLDAKGKPSPYPVVIFGGLHADVPITGAHGALIGDIIATSSTPAVVDTRSMTVGDRTRFFTDFAETLLRKNRGPLNLVIDEAHIFAPQRGGARDPNSGKMLHAANNLVSLGRSIGLRIILISQRPAKLHKDSLTQVETLVALRLIHPLDRKAVDDWIGECTDPAQSKEILASLPSLPVGDAWIWSPALGLLERKHFPLAGTYDSGKAPTSLEAGPVLKMLDLAGIKDRLASIEEEAKASDPKVLKAEVARLTRELAKAQKDISAPHPAESVVARKQEIDAARDEGQRVGIALGITRAQQALAGLRVDNIQFAPPSGETIRSAKDGARGAVSRKPPTFDAAPHQNGIPASQQRVLDAIAWWSAVGIEPVERNRAAVIAGLSPKASTFGVYVSKLAAAGLVDPAVPAKVSLTEAGRDVAYVHSDLSKGKVVAEARLMLGPAAAGVFDLVVAAYPEWLGRGELADQAGLSRTASTLGVYISKSSTLGFIETQRGQVRAADWLFP